MTGKRVIQKNNFESPLQRFYSKTRSQVAVDKTYGTRIAIPHININMLMSTSTRTTRCRC